MRQFCDRVDAQPGAVRKAIYIGRIPQNADGTIPVEAIAMWMARDESQVRAKPGSASAEAVKVRNAINRAKAQKEFFAAKTAELNYKKLAGELVDASEVKKRAFENGRRLRDRLTAMALRTGPALAGMKDPKACTMLLQREIARACEGPQDEESPEKGSTQPDQEEG